MAMDPKPQVETLPGEQRTISSVNQTRSPISQHRAVILILLISCIVLGVLYWKHRHHANQVSQETLQKDLQLTNAVPARTFTELPAPAPPILPPPLPEADPEAHLGQDYHMESYSQDQNKIPHVLDKAGSCLMVTAPDKIQQNQSVAVQSDDNSHGMAKMLTGTSTPMSQAQQLKNRNFILAKGSFIDCALQTKLDSTVPGMTACVVTHHIYSDNGKVILIERGSTISGEYKSNLHQGMARIFVLWTRIKTPTGVIVNLDSPGTDQLGGAGLPGYIDDHFWHRFGGALLLSLVDDAVDVASSRLSQQNHNQISFNETVNSTQDMATETLKNTINIPPTLYKNQGEQIGIYVARDLDFSSVYDVTTR